MTLTDATNAREALSKASLVAFPIWGFAAVQPAKAFDWSNEPLFDNAEFVQAAIQFGPALAVLASVIIGYLFVVVKEAKREKSRGRK